LRVRLTGAALFLTVLWCLASLAGTQRPELVVYSSVGAAPAVAGAYARETGRTVSVLMMSTGTLLARVSAEARHPRWDVIWFEGDDGAIALDRAGLLARHVVPDLDWTSVGRSVLPADGAYEPTGFTLAGVFLSRRELAPATQDWTHAMEAGRVGMADPALSGPAYQLLVGMLSIRGGWPAGQSALQRMAAEGLLVAPSNPAVLVALRAGRIDSAIVQSSAGIALSRADRRFVVGIPTPAFILPSIAAIASGQPVARRPASVGFLHFVMRPDIQVMRMGGTDTDRLFWPVTTRPAQPALPDPGGIVLTHPDPAIWGPLQAEVTGWFDRVVAR
ncbi:MAG: extracellular solute-binding protein, partial [Acetobacter sp.]|uniref:ABC transporter substrate-binding protein n=1 Tax=Acetobacter sp. TaxID=440 RepID=UPI0039E74D1A